MVFQIGHKVAFQNQPCNPSKCDLLAVMKDVSAIMSISKKLKAFMSYNNSISCNHSINSLFHCLDSAVPLELDAPKPCPPVLY